MTNRKDVESIILTNPAFKISKVESLYIINGFNTVTNHWNGL